MSLAIPQGFRRGVLSVATILLFAWSLDSSQSWGIILYWNDNAMGNIWRISYYCPSKSSYNIPI